MEQVIMMAFQTAQEYAQKSSVHSLTEYEMLMYESVCNMLKSYAEFLDITYRKCRLQADIEYLQELKRHKKWLEEHGNLTSDGT